MGLFRKKRKEKPVSPLMTWIAVLFLAYAIFSNNSKKEIPNKDEIKTSSITNSDEDKIEIAKENDDLSLGSILDPKKILNIDVIKDRLLPQIKMKLHVQDETLGDGSFATCGQNVTINYKSFLERDKEIESKENFSFQIGEGKVIPALERGVLGMRNNGKRTIFSPGSMAYGNEQFIRKDVPALANIRFTVELLDISPNLPDYTAYRILGDPPQPSVFSCGSPIKLHVAIWSIDGKKLYDTKNKDNNSTPITFTIGKSEVFLGLEQGALGMSTKMRRNLIVPPTMQKTLYNKPPVIDFPFPENQTVLVDIESVN